MAEYIFPAFIFITSIFILLILFNPAEKIMGWICFIIAGFFTYISVTIASTFLGHTSSILFVEFLFTFGLLAVLAYFKRDRINFQTSGIVYSVIMAIAFFSGKGCYTDDQQRIERHAAEKKAIADFKAQYDFNVDSLLINVTPRYNGYKLRNVKRFPAIIYTKLKSGYSFDVGLNQELGRDLISFNLDSINTIILIEYTSSVVGTYSNGKTEARQSETILTFMDRLSHQVISHQSLMGSQPPSSIQYRRSAPEASYGARPSYETVLNAIREELQLKDKY